jgi:hypothetical protein
MNRAAARRLAVVGRRMRLDHLGMASPTIRCPSCRTTTLAAMPNDACVFFWECPSCLSVLRPKPGDCCVLSSRPLRILGQGSRTIL